MVQNQDLIALFRTLDFRIQKLERLDFIQYLTSLKQESYFSQFARKQLIPLLFDTSIILRNFTTGKNLSLFLSFPCVHRQAVCSSFTVSPFSSYQWVFRGSWVEWGLVRNSVWIVFEKVIRRIKSFAQQTDRVMWNSACDNQPWALQELPQMR